MRATCCVALLLASAVQQKLCALPPVHRDGRRAASPAAPEDRGPRKKAPPRLTLISLVPDVAPPRWPGHLRLAATQRGQPLPAAAWRSGGADPGRTLAGEAAPGNGLFARRRSAFALPLLHLVDGFETHRAQRFAQVFGSVILRTGPPAV